MKKVVRQIAVLGLVVVMLVMAIPLSGCGRQVFTEEEHIERITERLQARYFGEDGTPTDRAIFGIQGEENVIQYVTLERFEVSIIYAFDGKPEYFMIQYFPVEIGYSFGIIFNNEYRSLGGRGGREGLNPFDYNEIESNNRFAAFTATPNSVVLATKYNNEWRFLQNGLFDNTQERIDRQLAFTRSRRGRRAITTHLAGIPL